MRFVWWLFGVAVFASAQPAEKPKEDIKDIISCPDRIKERRENGVEDIPYIVYVEYENRKDPIQSPMNGCGIIIDRNMVLTTAHICESSAKKAIKVYGGMTYVGLKTVPMYVAEYNIHPSRGRRPFDETNVYMYPEDLKMPYCMLRLSSPFKYGPGVQKAALPSKEEPLDRGALHLVSGWGPFRDNTTIQGHCSLMANPDFTRASLFHNRPPISSQQECQSQMTTIGLAATDEIFCMGYKCINWKTAYGDEGGPIVHERTQKVVGMVVNSRKADRNGTDQPMAALGPAVEWIEEKRKEWLRYLDELDFAEVTQGPGFGNTAEGVDATPGGPPAEGGGDDGGGAGGRAKRSKRNMDGWRRM